MPMILMYPILIPETWRHGMRRVLNTAVTVGEVLVFAAAAILMVAASIVL